MESTRDKIIKATVILFVQQGVATTTTREIASLAEVAEGSIYRYFPSKEELAWQIFRDYHHQLAAILQANAEQPVSIREQITNLVVSFLQLADEDWVLFQYYLSAQQKYMHKIDANLLTPYQVIVNIIRQGIKQKLIRPDNPQIMAAMAMGAVHQVAINKQFKRINGPLSVHSKTISDVICRMLLLEDRD